MKNDFIKKLFPKSLWTGQFTIAWIVSVLTFLTFDIYWCSITTFRSLGFAATYIYALLAGTIFTLPIVLFPKKAWVQLIVWILLDFLLIANIMYYRTYFTAIPASSYMLAGNLSDFKTSVTDSLRWADAIFIALSFIGFLFVRIRKYANNSIKPYLVTLGVMAVLAGAVTIPYKGLVNHTKYLVQQCYFTNCPPVVYTIFGKIATDVLTSRETLTDKDMKEVTEWFDLKNSLQGELNSDSIEPRRKNLVFIFLESIESWPIGIKVEGQEITPNINKWLNDSTTFFAPNVITQVGNGRSIDSQLLNLAGMYPMNNEVYAMTHSDNEYFTLPKAMKEATPGTRAYILSGDKATVWNQVRVAKSFGIDTLLDASHWKITDKIGNPPKLSDEALFTQIVEKCRNNEIFPVDWQGGAFIQVICYSSHNPFRIPEERQHIKLHDKYTDKFAEYLTAVNYVDHSVGILVDYLKTRPDWNETSVVIIGDHEGLAVYRDNMFKDPLAKDYIDPQQHTPLIMLNSPVPGKFEGTMGQVDVYSTLLDILGLDSYVWRGMGQSVLNKDFYCAAVDPNGNMITDGYQTLSAEQQKLLKNARNVSDKIIKFDLLKDSLH